jgi:predicted Zn-dependent peptidase
MKRFLFLASLLLSSTSLVHAASTPAAAARAKLFDPATLSEKTLSNGVRGVVQEAPGTDLVSVQVWVRAGSRYETTQNNGVTHLIETLALQSSKNFPAKPGAASEDSPGGGPQRAIGVLGGNASSLTSRDSVFFSATVASPLLSSALRILADATLRPDLSDARVEAAKQQLLSELVVSNADPLHQSSDLAYGTAFARHPYRLLPQGSPVGLEALTGSIVRAYHSARFAGSNISVVVTGDTSRATAHALIAQYFGAAPKAPPEPAIANEAPPTIVRRTARRGVLPVTTMVLAWRSPPVTDAADSVAMDMLLAHWKEGYDARLRSVLHAAPLNANEDEESIGPADDDENAPGEKAPDERAPKSTPARPDATPEDELPLALAFDADYLTQHDSGLFLITLVAPHDRNATVAAVLQEVNHVRDDGLTETELARARFLLTEQYLEQSESVGGLAGALGFYETIDNYKFATDYLNRVAHITNEDIKRMAQKYLTPGAYVQATIEGRAETRPQDNNGTLSARLF